MQPAARIDRNAALEDLVSADSSSLSISTLGAATAPAQELTLPESSPAASLRKRHEALREQLEQSPLQPGLYLESIERSNILQGDAYASVDYPFATVSNAFSNPGICAKR